MASPRTNSRKNARVTCLIPALAEGPRGLVRGTCRSLSQGGMFFCGPTLPLGQRLQLSMDLPSGRFEAVGEVRYHVSESQPNPGMGIRFTRLAEEHLRRLREYVQAG